MAGKCHYHLGTNNAHLECADRPGCFRGGSGVWEEGYARIFIICNYNLCPRWLLELTEVSTKSELQVPHHSANPLDVPRVRAALSRRPSRGMSRACPAPVPRVAGRWRLAALIAVGIAPLYISDYSC